MVAAPFNGKARSWRRGRRGWYRQLEQLVDPGARYTWIHCASLGEFEQGRTLIEEIRKEDPGGKILLTFFSPSGYEMRKKSGLADIICYLPPDTPANAVRFINLVNPRRAIFVKYEFWNNYIGVLSGRGIDLYLVSAIFRKEQQFFAWYGAFFRKMLQKFTWIFVQERSSLDLLDTIGIYNVTVAGDTRFDRVVQIAAGTGAIEIIDRFRGNEPLFLAGSSWKRDEEIITRYINRYPGKMKWVFAPHEPSPANVERLEKLLNVKHVRFSCFGDGSNDARVLIMDNVGMLSSAYRYACIAAVGGGFGRGIHNILEPACWGIPVMFGPRHQKFREAVELARAGGARSFSNHDDFVRILEEWTNDQESYRKAAFSAGQYVRENTGATAIIMKKISGHNIKV
jgi:3-deoxy-D-manno-octulosonic-acid transferase